MAVGQRDLPRTIDELAQRIGTQVWARYPVSPEAFEEGQLRPVNFSTLSNAINRLAWRLDALFPGHEDMEPICYIGPSDIRYFILACAACKCRLKTLFSSPRNNLAAHQSLLDSVKCRVLMGPHEGSRDSTLRSLVASRDLREEAIPSLDNLLSPESVRPFPWDRAFDEIANETFVVLHTSGTTGLPKPVNVTHGLIATVDEHQELPAIDGRIVTARSWANRSVYNALPPFHAAGINFFCYTIFQSTELVLGPCDRPPSLSTVEQILKIHAADCAILPPSLLAEVAMDETLLRSVSQWSNVTFGGGPLAQEAGDALSKQTKVLQILGSTETFNLPEFAPSPADEWEYHSFHPNLGIEFRPHSGGLHELVFVRDERLARYQGAFRTFPDRSEYSMKDLYEQHPSKPGHWRYRGRLDDIIVLSNGEKFNPTDVERLITQDRAVKSALVVGDAREQLVLLVEPADLPAIDPEQRRASVVQAVEQANETLPGHAQIHASHVLVLDSPDTFLRSSKGEVRRAPTADALSDLITRVYQTADRSSVFSSGLDFRSERTLAISLTQLLSTDFLGGQQLTVDDNIFQYGIDSLRAAKLLRYIKAGLRDQDVKLGITLTPRAIYQHPTASAMASMLMQLRQGGASITDETKNSLTDMKRLLRAFTTRLDNLGQRDRTKILSDSNVVVLTGSTGSLGSYMLDSLIRTPTIQKIVCLNRAGGDAHKQARTNRARGLHRDFSNVEFLEADLTKPSFGLESERYDRLLREASHIIHNAWPVNFNITLCSFEPQLEICCRLIEVAHASPNNVSTTFLSSVGVGNNWARYCDGPVPERMLDDFRVSETMGYAQSKQLAELLFVHASEKYGLPLNVCRLGQIAGPVRSDQGEWNPQEWFPSLLLSCKGLGKVPDTLGAMDRMDWIPVDLLSDILVDAILPNGTNSSPDTLRGEPSGPPAQAKTSNSLSLSASGRSSPNIDVTSPQATPADPESPSVHTTFLHFVNPHDTFWRDMVDSLVRQDDSDVEVVPYADWLSALSGSADQEDTTDDVPAVKLIDYFQEIGGASAERPVFSTAVSRERSKLLRELEPVSLPWVRRWLSQWREEDTMYL